MKRKWAKRSDVILLAMIALWFAGAVWGMAIVTLQVIRGDYSVDLNSVLTYIGVPVGGGIVTWLVKNLTENITKTKANPDYLRDHPGDDI